MSEDQMQTALATKLLLDMAQEELSRMQASMTALRGMLRAAGASDRVAEPAAEPKAAAMYSARAPYRAWSREQKRAALQRAWGPRGVGPAKVTREMGLGSHLYKWREAARAGKL